MYNLDNYINFLKEKLENNFFSPLLIKLANLYFFNDQYDNCIKICNMVTELFPFYLTPKILKVKALIKLEYFNEAESELKDIENKIQNKELIDLLYSSLDEFKKKQSQAKIFYKEMLSDLDKFEDYEDKLRNIPFCDTLPDQNNQELVFIDNELFANLENDAKFKIFLDTINSISIDAPQPKKNSKYDDNTDLNNYKNDSKDSILGNVKIITETIADVIAKQGLHKEAFDAYTLLLRAGHKNKKRILEKIADLERRM
ncbi:MAG: hypothetical protein ACOYN6_02675 [Ignavibacteria bacterium]